MFGTLKKESGYKKWCLDNKINDLFEIDLDKYGKINKKIDKGIYGPVDPNNKDPLPSELDDLIRLHYLVRTRKVTTILEFGVGKSTIVFADAIKKNKKEFGFFVQKNLRRANPFEIHSVDNIGEWIDNVSKA